MDKRMIIRLISSLIGTLCFFALIWHGLRYILVDDSTSYTRVMMHEYYTQDNIDVLFCGASLCYRSFDTGLLDRELHANTFNLGSSSQCIDLTYYLIKDALDRYDVKQVFLELSPIIAVLYAGEKTSANMTGVYLISDYMKWSWPKTKLLLNASGPDSYANSFLLARREWQKIYNFGYLSSVLQKKRQDTYKEYGYDYLRHDSEWYKGKGYVENDTGTDEGCFNDFYFNSDISISNIDVKWYYYLEKIIEECEKHKVQLTFVCAPLSDYLLSSYGAEYDNYHKLISDIAEESGIAFWDFSLVKYSFLPVDSKCYTDSAHLNRYGAQVFSDLLAKLANNELEYSEICYKRVKDKLQENEARVLGIARIENNKFQIVINQDGELEYKIIAEPTDGESYLVRDYSEDKDFVLTDGETGTITLLTRHRNNRDNVDEYIFSY